MHTKPNKTALKFFVLAIAGTLIYACATQNKQNKTSDKGLKDYYSSCFPMGVAVNASDIRGEKADFIVKNYESVTPENAMKMGPIHPLKNKYNFKDADSIVAFAVKNGLKVRGHALCWHEQTPDWLFKDSLNQDVTKTELLSRLKDHIFTVVKRYKGKIYAWDVVNEAIDDDSTKFLRNSKWFQICGEDFIFKAFEYAHEADPQAKLFYNDYNVVRPEKRERVAKLLKKLLDAKIPINGVGMQGHWSIFEPSEADLKKAIEQFSALELEVQITELDISIYAWEKERRARKEGESDAFIPALEQKQADKYKMVFDVLRANKKNVSGVTFWNLSDGYSWLDFYPVPGRKNYPLLFDAKLQPKKAFWEVVNFKN
ncbi:endo-1,4-beta-xylanase [Pedobacter sp. MW01-1-1]|uniref:endo-1,4-beta-xylanase n=1 Tax=Pedobacter sp. MW01-1-1 TaxID=3383027 RepID=UPI003FEF5693